MIPLVVRQLVVLRRRAGWSQREVARRLGTSQSAISELEAGITSPTLRILSGYAALFGMEPTLSVKEA